MRKKLNCCPKCAVLLFVSRLACLRLSTDLWITIIRLKYELFHSIVICDQALHGRLRSKREEGGNPSEELEERKTSESQPRVCSLRPYAVDRDGSWAWAWAIYEKRDTVRAKRVFQSRAQLSLSSPCQAQTPNLVWS